MEQVCIRNFAQTERTTTVLTSICANVSYEPKGLIRSRSSPDKSGGLNKSTQHHLIERCLLRVVLYGVREAVWIFCGREEQDLESLEVGTVAA
jgi:hypothetical protein